MDDELKELIDFCLKFSFGHGYLFTNRDNYKMSAPPLAQPVDWSAADSVRWRTGFADFGHLFLQRTGNILLTILF
jgi:hypothetical protein